MSGKFRVPRLALAALVLGGCGDGDGPGDQAKDASEPVIPDSWLADDQDAGPTDDSDPDAQVSSGSARAADEQDGGTQGDAAAGSAELDVSDERIQAVFAAFCKTAFDCDPKTAAQQLESEDHCVESMASYTHDDIEQDGAECGDVELDKWDCYAHASCEEQFTACTDLADLEQERCPTVLGGS